MKIITLKIMYCSTNRFSFVKTLTYLLCLLIYSCVTDIPANKSESGLDTRTLVADQTEKQVLTLKPTKIFMQLVKYMDSCGYRCDTVLNDKSNEHLPVVVSDYKGHVIHDFLKSRHDYGRAFFDSSAYKPSYDSIFSAVENIFVYHWDYGRTNYGLDRKGTVEEWVFNDEAHARRAYEFLLATKSDGFPFFQTAAYYLKCKNYLYLFYSWNSGVAYRHQKFHKWLGIEYTKHNEKNDLYMSSN